MAQPATRYPSPEPTSINFFQAKLALEQQFPENHAGADTKGAEGGAISSGEHKASSVSSDRCPKFYLMFDGTSKLAMWQAIHLTLRTSHSLWSLSCPVW